MRNSINVFVTVFWGVFGLGATAVAQPSQCQAITPQVLDPIDLVIGQGLVAGCGADETVCHLSAVLETDGAVIENEVSSGIYLLFQANHPVTSDFSIEIMSWIPIGPLRPATVYLGDNKGNVVPRDTEVELLTVWPDLDRQLVLTVAYVTCAEAEKYVNSLSGQIEVWIGGTGTVGDNDRWVDEVEIVIPPPS